MHSVEEIESFNKMNSKFYIWFKKWNYSILQRKEKVGIYPKYFGIWVQIRGYRILPPSNTEVNE